MSAAPVPPPLAAPAGRIDQDARQDPPGSARSLGWSTCSHLEVPQISPEKSRSHRGLASPGGWCGERAGSCFLGAFEALTDSVKKWVCRVWLLLSRSGKGLQLSAMEEKEPEVLLNDGLVKGADTPATNYTQSPSRHQEDNPKSTAGKNVLSLFDGIGGAYHALVKAGIPIMTYRSSEVDRDCNALLETKVPGINHLGSVYGIKVKSGVDILIGGSPCKDLAGCNTKGEGLNGDESKKFFEFVRILRESSPSHFFFENVGSMTKESQEKMSSILGCKPIRVDAGIFSPQRRVRLYWTDIQKIPIPSEASDLVLRDVEDQMPGTEAELAAKYKPIYELVPTGGCWRDLPKNHPERVRMEETRAKYKKETGKNPGGQSSFWRVFGLDEKAPTLLAEGTRQRMTRFVLRDSQGRLRYPTRSEVARLQGFPADYLDGVPNITKAYRMAGNAFQVDTVAHLLSGLTTTIQGNRDGRPPQP